MGDRERKEYARIYTPSHGLEGRERDEKGVAVASTVDLELLEEIYWAQRKISQVRQR